MSDSSPPIGTTTGSLAIRPRRLDTTRLEKEHLYGIIETVRRASQQLKDVFKALQSEVEPYIAPDQELPEEKIRLERELIASERDAGSISPQTAKKRFRENGQRYFSAGDDLWRHKKKKMRLANPEPEEVPILDIRRGGVSDCILTIYRKSDGVGRPKKRPKNWRRDVLQYYNGNGADHETRSDQVWCHVSGNWFHEDDIKAAHIVPYFLDFEGSMLMALACHFETSDLEVMNSWMTEHGFDAPLQLTDDELVETARRVHLAVEDRAIRAEYGNGNGSDDESDDGSDNNDSSEEED
ncbi:hypothetical protein E4U32_002562 [Claviceps aff. humidiphila group G2b]|nr:hypothetical protein E4U32_002562 [Claviceps aff. humidiphila group G2b]